MTCRNTDNYLQRFNFLESKNKNLMYDIIINIDDDEFVIHI